MVICFWLFTFRSLFSRPIPCLIVSQLDIYYFITFYLRFSHRSRHRSVSLLTSWVPVSTNNLVLSSCSFNTFELVQMRFWSSRIVEGCPSLFLTKRPWLFPSNEAALMFKPSALSCRMISFVMILSFSTVRSLPAGYQKPEFLTEF